MNRLFRKSAGPAPSLWKIRRDNLQKEFTSVKAKYEGAKETIRKMTLKQEKAIRKSSLAVLDLFNPCPFKLMIF
jgi:hypothetical protein